MQIITDKAGWRSAIAGQGTFDFYHTYEYHILHNNEEPRLFVFENGNERLCLPLLLRTIEGTSYSDLTSVYGYAGCLYNVEHPSHELLQKVNDELSEFAFDNGIISVFSRLHTLIPNASLLPDGLGEIVELNRTVYIPTTETEEDQISLYSSSLKRQLNVIEKSGLSFRIASSKEDWVSFYAIYTQSMTEKEASADYFFNTSYFMAMKNARDYESILLLAEWEGEVVAGALFVVCGEFMQYHLGAVSTLHQKLSPLKLLIDRARRIGTERKIKYLHLGGGKNGVDDGLFQFKSGFSHQFTTFRIWRWIVDEDIYNHLSEGLPEGRFPRYRNIH